MAVKVELGRGHLSSPQLLSKVSYSRTNSGSREFMPKNKTDQVQSPTDSPFSEGQMKPCWSLPSAAFYVAA